MGTRTWFKLDNIGTFYSFTNKDYVPAVFRYSVTLISEINPVILKTALLKALEYFPNFKCHLRKGLFWYYLETSDQVPNVTQEDNVICSKIYKDDEDFLFRITYYKKRINLEVSHILSDGRGSLNFFKCLIYNYLILKENLKNIESDIDSSPYEKNEDSFDKYYKKEKIKLPKFKKIYHYKGGKQKDITYLEYHISTSETIALAHQYQASLTSLLIAVLICAYREKMKIRELDQIIKIDVPVDLRPFYKSATSRNFFALASVTYQFKSENYNFHDVITSVNKQLQKEVTEEKLKKRMNHMISLEKNIIARFIPTLVKDLILKLADDSTSGCTSCLSNIGKITVHSELEPYIENFNVLTTAQTLKLTICSYKDDLSIGISSKYISKDIIKSFVRFFSNHKIHGLININEEDSSE